MILHVSKRSFEDWELELIVDLIWRSVWTAETSWCKTCTNSWDNGDGDLGCRRSCINEGEKNSNLQGDNSEAIINVGKSGEESDEKMTAECNLFRPESFEMSTHRKTAHVGGTTHRDLSHLEIREKDCAIDSDITVGSIVGRELLFRALFFVVVAWKKFLFKRRN